jgi:two-component system sensor histidine kinase/response regulator
MSKDRVLIIEDSRAFAELLKQLIGNAHRFECDIAASYADAKTLLQESANEYFASIVDLNLPDAAHGEATDLVVAAGVPALVFTSSSDQALKEDLWERGIADYAHKSGAYSLEYITWVIGRLHKNHSVELLVVDDSLVSRKTMQKLLATQKYQVHVAADEEQALKILEERPGIAVAILDAYLKESTGFELAAKIREQRNGDSIEIIGVSSQGGTAVSAQFIKSGANDFLLKPFVPEEFLCRVNRSVDRIDTYQQLNQLNHTKNQFIGTAAHDIRGPLGAIKTASELLVTRDLSPERQSSLQEMILKSSDHLLSLLSELLDVSAIEGGEIQLNLENTDLSEKVQDRASLFASQADEKNIQVDTDLAQTSVSFDPVKLVQVIDNLLTNALKFTPEGGRIVLSVEQDEKHVIFKVEDSGPGVAEAEQKKLFDAYETLSNRSTAGEKSTGLGLAIAKKVILAHQGRIQYRDSKLGGSCFAIYLPL